MTSQQIKAQKKNNQKHLQSVMRQQALSNCIEQQECMTSVIPLSVTQTIVYPYNKQEKIIPGYNYQSLFRKKSHIRLAKKKIKEESLKKDLDAKDYQEDKQSKNIQKGHWTNDQNRLYHWFLQIHSEHFINKHLRRTDKIFKSMANFIKSRQAQQCRSHHQKMQKKYHNFYQIVVKLRHQFYNGTDPQQILGDIKQNGYQVKSNRLMTQIQLKNITIKRQLNEQSSQSQNQSQKSQEDKGNNNILDQNYQIGLNFDNIRY